MPAVEPTTEIAVVGIGCRLPGGVSGPDQLWEFLIGKGDGIVDMPADRWNIERFYDADPDVPGRMYTRRGGFLTQSLWDFDPEFFGISAREASIMDPQQRLLLEVAAEALDDAGLAGRVAGRPVGVYVGGFTMDNMIGRHTPEARSAINSHTPTSGTYTMLSNRVSFVFDLRGPSMTIDTACSSSLVALHEGYQALVRGEIEAALIGGVNTMLSPETFVSMCKGRFLSPDGRCKTFDATADGYARGEGAGMLVIKPLAAALRDHDRVYAVIRATGSNQDGRTSGITVPNPEAQRELIEQVVARSGLRPADIGYIEAHGTGTAVGDPLEMSAIGAALGAVEGRDETLVVGSIKNSIGHLEAAAGVAGVIKAALSVQKRRVAPQFHVGTLNPAIPFEAHRLRVPLEAEPFPAPEGAPAAAAVNGFGYGGTNAHAVVVEPPAAEVAPKRRSPAQVFPLSARSDAAGRALAAEYAAEVRRAIDEAAVATGGNGAAAAAADAAAGALVDAVWTRRAHHHVRFGVPFSGAVDLAEQLEALASGQGRAAGRTVVEPGTRPVFVFSGMGPQWWRMGRDLLAAGGAFAATAREVDERFRALAGWSILEELLRDEADSRVTSTEVAQPANFLVQVALVAELAGYGVHPAAVVGHSVGEVSAAYVSGALSLDDALLVSLHRSRLQATLAGTGSMLAVGLPEHDAMRWIEGLDGVCVAAVNSATALTLAGDRQALDTLREQLVDAGVFARELRVEVPYHSHLMDPILDELIEVLAPVTPRVPELPLWSTVTGTRVEDASWGARYWADNVRQPVRFAAAVDDLLDAGHRLLCEVGPHPVLSGNVRELVVRRGETATCVPTLNRGQDDVTSVRRALADLYVGGGLDERTPPGGDPGPAPWRDLPRHPFARVHLWTEAPGNAREHLGDPDAPALPGDRTSASAPEWETSLAAARYPWLPDHVVSDLVLLPGAAYLDAALAAARTITGRATAVLADVRFLAPLVVGPHEAPVLRLSVEPGTARFAIRSRPATDDTWILHSTGRIVDADAHPVLPRPAGPAAGHRVDGPDLYTQLAARGLAYGPAFRRVVTAEVGQGVVVATVDASPAQQSGHVAHPTVTDAALQCVAALVAADQADGAAGAGGAGGPVVPASVADVRFFAPLPPMVEVTVTRRPGQGLHADVVLRDAEDGATVLELADVEFLPVNPPQPPLADIEPLWMEPVFEPAGDRAAAAGPTDRALLVVALGTECTPFASELAAATPGARVVTVTADDPAVVAADLADVVEEAVGRRSTAVGVAVVAVEQGTPEPAERVHDAHRLVAGLTGTARAVQGALDRALMRDGESVEGLLPVDGVVIVRGGLAVPGDLDAPDMAAAALIGARRVVRNEQPVLRWRLIDVDSDRVDGELLAEMQPVAAGSGVEGSEDVDEVALRDGLRMVVRVRRRLSQRTAALDVAVPLAECAPDPGELGWAIEAPAGGLLTDVALRREDRVEPGPGQVELRIECIGLNYKDPLKVMGILTERELAGTYFGTELGMDGLGVVTRVGPGVERWSVGDRVLVGAPGIARRYLVVDTEVAHLDPAPADWSLGDYGSNVPFLTAHYAVTYAARVQPGDTVLVHGAAGGVGMAAVQLAKLTGATVIASASTPERGEIARSMGAEHVVSSRAVTFVDEVLALTGGRGVDVVISSAPGEILAANLDVAAEFGRVVEVGKSEIYGGRAIDLKPFDKNLSFSAIDIDRMFAHRRDLLVRLQAEVLDLVASGQVRCLPSTVFPPDRLAEALDAVARSSAEGRVVIDMGAPEVTVRPARPTVPIRRDGTYLVTGGLGAFGLRTARWLAARGAGVVVLAGRGGVRTAEQAAAVAALEQSGTRVVVEQVDIAEPAAVEALLARLAADLPPLAGVLHAAGVLQDEPFTELSTEALAKVLRPKAIGAWNLHRSLERLGLSPELFVLYSSVTALAGTVPQLPYAAANTALDVLAHLRRREGLPAVSIDWGALSGGGMAESSQDVARYLEMIGLRAIDMQRAADFLDQVLAFSPTQAAVVDIDWATWSTMYPASASTTRFRDIVAEAGTVGAGAGALRAELAKLDAASQLEVTTYVLAEQVAAVLGVPAESVDVAAALPDLGLDSLMAVELSARVNTTFGLQVSALEFSRGGGLTSLAARLLDQLGTAREPAAPAPSMPTPAAPSDVRVEIDITATEKETVR